MMTVSEAQILNWLDEISDDGSELIDDLVAEVDFDSDDSQADPTYFTDLDDEIQYIDVSDQTDVQTTSAHVQKNTGTSRIEVQQPGEKWLITPSETVMRGKNKYIWSTAPSSSKRASNRTASRNIVHIMPGPKGEAKGIVDPLKCFELFFTSELLDEILLRTNEFIDQAATKYKHQKTTISHATMKEIRALLGVLILSGALKNNHLSTNELFDPTLCGSQNLAAMSCKRFEFLIRCLHFDDRNTRDDRRKTDKFAPIRYIWEAFIKQCRDMYKPGSYVTIDEQLLAFRGRCPFRMYIPNKPAKYGIKIVLLCDVRSKYMIDASPYLGKNGTATINEPLGSHYCKLLTKTIHGTNRNLTADNWFTSVPLAEQLLKPPYNLTFVGTIRSNKQEIPAEFKHNSSRPVGTSLFGFHENLTLVSYHPKPQKTVLLLSTMHDKPSIDAISGKPVIIQTYNETKGAVDTFDQMCGHSSCGRKTKRWPLCIFYGMLNMALLNSYVIYVSNCEVLKTKPMSRREFLKKISKDLCTDWCSTRLEERPRMKKRVRVAIQEIIGNNTDEYADQPVIKKGKRSKCDFCPPKSKRMSVYFCANCKKTYCLEHRSPNCGKCDAKK